MSVTSNENKNKWDQKRRKEDEIKTERTGDEDDKEKKWREG
jgi:hypothetical protein